MYYAHHWELAQSWYPFVCHNSLSVQTAAQRLIYGYSSTGFVAFDAIKATLQDDNGKISGPRTVVAGFGAGVTESLLAVTPFESIKTQL